MTPPLPGLEWACDGQTAWGDLCVCPRRRECWRFVAAPTTAPAPGRYRDPDAVGDACGDFLPLPLLPSDA